MGYLVSYLAFLFIAAFRSCICSEITFTASPKLITDRLTDTLKLRCSIQDTASDSGAIVGRQISDTEYNIQHVNSIIISRGNTGNDVIGEILTAESPKVFADPGMLTADGNLTPSHPEYLELTWTNPGQNQSGIYSCEINALDPQGHSITLQSSIEVGLENPDINDLIDEINDLKSMISSLKPPHDEEGIVYCDNSDSWPITGGDSTKASVQTVAFKTPYSDPPHITISPVYVDVIDGHNERYRYYIQEITTTGFKIVCETWNDTKVFRLNIRWTSY